MYAASVVHVPPQALSTYLRAGQTHGQTSINQSRSGAYICDTFVLLDLILKCERRIPLDTLQA